MLVVFDDSETGRTWLNYFGIAAGGVIDAGVSGFRSGVSLIVGGEADGLVFVLGDGSKSAAGSADGEDWLGCWLRLEVAGPAGAR